MGAAPYNIILDFFDSLSNSPPGCCIQMGSIPENEKGTLLGALEQGTGIEPAFTAWEAVVLPIYEPCV